MPRYCVDEKRMKIEKQTNKLDMRAWYFKHAGFLPVLVEMQVWPPPSFLLVSDPGSDTQSVLQFVSSKQKNLTHALTNLCTSLKSGCVFHSACLLVCFLIISLFLFYFVLDAIFCLFCLCSLSPLPYFFFSSTLFSLQVLVCLRDCTPCLASFQASGCFNAPISLLS